MDSKRCDHNIQTPIMHEARHALALLVGMLHRLCELSCSARAADQPADQLRDSSTDLYRSTRFDLKALLPRISCTYSSFKICSV